MLSLEYPVWLTLLQHLSVEVTTVLRKASKGIPGEYSTVGEILKEASESVRWHGVDCTDPELPAQHSDISAGAGDFEEIACRYLVTDDFSPRAVEVLGQNFGIDPRVFMNHLHQSLEGIGRKLPPISRSGDRFDLKKTPLPSSTMTTLFAVGDTHTPNSGDKTCMPRFGSFADP